MPRTGAVGDIIVEADGKSVRKLSDLTDVLERIQGARYGASSPWSAAAGSARSTFDVVDISRS